MNTAGADGAAFDATVQIGPSAELAEALEDLSNERRRLDKVQANYDAVRASYDAALERVERLQDGGE
jgi:Pyruvate/2-oxoacid:ferredoxin oxidoreductase gamma subunit